MPSVEGVGDPRRDIRFFCDDMDLDADGNLTVVGWAVCAVGISAIAVHLDDREVGKAELGLPRTDVGEEYRHIPMARYAGFRFAKALGDVPAGERRIRIVVRNGLDDTRDEVRTVLIERAPPPPPQAAPAQFRLEIDTPTVTAGVAVEPVTGQLTIEGWALARSGITGIEVLLDDQRLGDAHYGLVRQDVGVAFPGWVDSLSSGYAFRCPPRSLGNGDHVVQLNVHARSGEVLENRFAITVRKSEEFEDGPTIRRGMTQGEVDLSEDVLDSLGHRCVSSDPASGLGTRYRRDAGNDRVVARAGVSRLATGHSDKRLRHLPRRRRAGAEAAEDLAERIDVIDASDGAAFDQSIGSADASTTLRLVGLLSPGDRLGCDALLRIALASGLHRDADML